MKLNRFFVFLLIITIISLLYVQMQLEIFKSAYKARIKETQARDMLDTRTILVYNIHRLESAQNLGKKILCANTDLQFTKEDQLASLTLPASLVKFRNNNFSNLMGTRYNILAFLFSFGSQAEATEKTKK